MRRAARTDNSQSDIVKALRGIGATVEPKLARLGDGIPDLLVGWRGCNVLLETKTGSRVCDRRLTSAEAVWHEVWGGQVATVSTPDEAVDAVLRAAGVMAK